MSIRTLETEPSAGMAEERVREMGGGWKAATVGGGGRNGGVNSSSFLGCYYRHRSVLSASESRFISRWHQFL